MGHVADFSVQRIQHIAMYILFQNILNFLIRFARCIQNAVFEGSGPMEVKVPIKVIEVYTRKTIFVNIRDKLMKICLFVYFCMLIPIMLLILVYRSYLRSYQCFFWPLGIPWEKAYSYFIINDEHWAFSVI